ncbi:MAG: phosphate acetyltransferase [Trueperaceae bacterium]|jgi:phosphate acetyltransferase|nr:phosphate acetyltransferase [Truepera sp.]HRN17716.1 phosphate acetyltransferase [Trueperaceae bacterium]HRQ10237.1 phosphate acetyltransferase [Trueperaceae bacterium]
MASAHGFFVVPTGPGVGLTSVCLGLVRALEREGLRVGFIKPIRQPGDDEGVERSTEFVRRSTTIEPGEPMRYAEAEAHLAAGRQSELLQALVGRYEKAAAGADVIIVEGLAATADHPNLDGLNAALARALDCQSIFVATPQPDLKALDDRLELAAQLFGGAGSARVLGVVVNQLNAPSMAVVGATRTGIRLPDVRLDAEALRTTLGVFRHAGFSLLGAIPWSAAMVSPRTLDVAKHLGAESISAGELATRRVVDVSLVARSVAHMTHRLRPGALLITPADRDDIILAACMAALNGVPLAGLVLTGDIAPNPNVMKLCEKAIATGLPVLAVKTDSYVTAARAAAMNLEVPIDDVERMERAMNEVAENLDIGPLKARLRISRELRLSPPAFLYRLVELSRAADKRIVLPEGDEPRTVLAAVECGERGIATCVLLGDPAEVHRVAEAQGVALGKGVEVIEPTDDLRERYVAAMVELRKHKGLTQDGARNQLRDNVVLGTMMLALGEVDGLVSGATHTTANTVRPALQLIKTHEEAKLVSSVFFMCLPDQVLVYGDCAVNPDPDAEELADIAIQSADSAAAFGIEPRVALLSYSTGTSGEGADVDKVREATRIARERRPDLVLDGPLQYDAATVPSVAVSKAPDSPVAGRATVLIFPDLNSGNATYKAVQRSAGVVSVGPMLQGLRRPVNDLSRGALVDDIVYTIALTAIQATATPGSSEPAASPSA